MFSPLCNHVICMVLERHISAYVDSNEPGPWFKHSFHWLKYCHYCSGSRLLLMLVVNACVSYWEISFVWYMVSPTVSIERTWFLMNLSGFRVEPHY